jgi:hypothetical protein
MRPLRATPAAISISCLAMFALAGTALGQNALGDGRKLDNNLNASQGRVNPRSTGVMDQMRYNNAVIHGTVTDGKYFHGSVGYRAPDRFGSYVGSDTLYDFNRDSYTSGLAAEGVRGSDALRYQFSLTTGQNIPGFLGGSPVSVARSGTVATGANSGALRSTSDFVTGQSYRPTLVGVKHDELGAEYVAKASPLLGVTWVKTAESPLGTATAPAKSASVPTIPGIPDSTLPPNPSDVTLPNVPGDTTARPQEKPVVDPFTGLESSSRGVPNVMDRPNAVDLRVQGETMQTPTSVHNQVLNRFREGFPAAAPKPGEEKANEPVTFEMQMDRLHRILQGTEEAEPKEPKDGRPERGPDGILRYPKPKSPTDGKPDATKPAEPNTPFRPSLAPAMEKDAKGKNIDPVLEALTPEFLRAVKKVQEKKIEHFVDPAPAVGPDTSTDPESYRVQMREGERLLSEGRFFDAEDLFVRAIACSPRDPMARAARLHAQLGAGLYLSAATNLRALLAGHPEMIATRYTDNLLPSAERSKVITEQLVEQEKRYDSALGRESALLLAYLGYQRGDAALVTDGLDKFSKRIAADDSGNPDRALLALLNAAWVKK